MAKKPKPEGKKYNYMDTYGDLVTLLLCFFVLLFAMSTVEEAKYNAFVEALSSRFGTVPLNPSYIDPSAVVTPGSEYAGDDKPTGNEMNADQSLPADLSQLEQALEQFVAQSGMEGEVSVETGANGTVFVRLSDNLLFNPNSSNLRPETLAFLDFLSEALNAVESQILKVQFNGHTASVDGSGLDDWVLSGERAGRVSSYVSNIGGFNRFKIGFSGYGRNFPIADNGTGEGRARNRRVDVIILGNEAANLEATLADAMRIYFPGDDTAYFEGDSTELPGAMLDTTPADAAVDPELEKLLEGLSPEERATVEADAKALAEERAATGAASTADTPERVGGAA